MIKFLISYSVAFFTIAQSSQAQQASNIEILDANNMTVPVTPIGIIFNDLVSDKLTGQKGFYQKVPKNTDKGTILSSALWIGGKDSINQLYTAVGFNNQSTSSFFFGPIATNYHYPFDSLYNRTWKITSLQIERHKQSFQLPNYVIPPVIAQWPAHGNTSNGEAANLAPYIDVNGNNLYDPQYGDYPSIRGTQAIYFITNDSKSPKYHFSPPMLIELHGMAYAFENSNDSILHNTIFVNYKIINRSNRDYTDLNIGIFTDFNIGNHLNDYVGSDVANNAFYGYNGVDHDSLVIGLAYNAYPDSLSYGANPPAQGVIFLGGPQMSSFMSISDSDPLYDDTHFYNFMRSTWKDGTPLTYGGVGYNNQSFNIYKFMFPGNSDPYGSGFQNSSFVPPFSWSEEQIDNTGSYNLPGNRKGVGSFGPMTLNSGDSYCFDVAFPFAQGNDRLHSVQLLRQRFQHIQNFYSTHFPDACNLSIVTGLPKTSQNQLAVNVFPNPANEILNFQLSEPAYKLTNVSIFDLSGKTVLESTFQDQHSHQLKIETLPAGMYIVQMSQGQTITREKLIINR